MVERIILHAGTPKTGTTSLQIVLDQYREVLAQRGLLYPRAMVAPGAAANRSYNVKPKHQWLVDDLMADNPARFADDIASVLGQMPSNINTLVLSTEGLFNHWWDFTINGRAALSDLARAHRMEIWVWFRNPIDFFVSHYIQMLRNPRTSVACHGRDWSPDEMLNDPWFAQRLEYMSFVDEARAVVGTDAVRVFAYKGTTVSDFIGACGLSDLGLPELQENPSFGEVGVAMLRLINHCSISADQKIAAAELVGQIDMAIGAASRPLALTEVTRARIMSMCGPSLERLRREIGIDLVA